MIVVDLFCGAGGFSWGASSAGAKVVAAVDCWAPALAVHAKNHPTTEHYLMELGVEFAPVADLIQSLGVKWNHELLHIHASPPCQNLSSSNVKRDVISGLRLVKWTCQLFRFLSDDRHVTFTFSMEQVSHPEVARLLKDEQIPFTKTSFAKYGVPQTRRRIWASSLPVLDIMKQDVTDWRLLVDIPRAATWVTGSVVCEKRLKEKNAVFINQRKKITECPLLYTITSKVGNLFRGEIEPKGLCGPTNVSCIIFLF